MWHAVRPIEDEPVSFKGSVQSELTDKEWQDLITPGTEINERWKSQVDVIAFFLKQLKNADVPVLWRPYHEMNGDWFWWGKRLGENGTKKLYRMLFDRLVNFHKLNNLIWVCNFNEIRENVAPYMAVYPGDDVVDILATDVYRGGLIITSFHLLPATSLLRLAKWDCRLRWKSCGSSRNGYGLCRGVFLLVPTGEGPQGKFMTVMRP
jgi:hypothetical protein